MYVTYAVLIWQLLATSYIPRFQFCCTLSIKYTTGNETLGIYIYRQNPSAFKHNCFAQFPVVMLLQIVAIIVQVFGESALSLPKIEVIKNLHLVLLYIYFHALKLACIF